MNPIGSTILISLIILILSAPRRYALLAFACGVLFLTQGQAVDVLGFNMFAVRFLELAGFARVIARGEFVMSDLNRLDRALAISYLFTSLIFVVRSNEGHAYWIGYSVDALLCYLTFRGLIRSQREFVWFLQGVVLLMIPYLGLLAAESGTLRNPFDFMNHDFRPPWLRSDRMRCFGSFRHPILMGTMGATFLPLFVGLALAGIKRMWAGLGILLCLGFVWFANSGGPLNTMAFGILGWLFWGLRHEMRKVRVAALAFFAFLAFAMKAPIWFLPSKASFISGGDGWHRSYLMGCAIRNIEQWWIWGMPLSETRDWFPYILHTTNAADVTNQFVHLGITAGFGAIIVFIWFLSRMFGSLGLKLEQIRSMSSPPVPTEYLLWGLGVVLSQHIINFIGITYFDQFYVIWFLHLAAITNFTTGVAEDDL